MAKPLDLEEFALSNESVKSMEGNDTGEEVVLEDGEESLLGVKAVPTPPDLFLDEDQVEALLSEKLMDGFMLLDTPCPKCTIPLVKKPKSQDNSTIATNSSSASGSHDNSDEKSDSKNRLVSPRSLEGISKSKTIHCIPYCVICESYVVTSRSDVKILGKLKVVGENASTLPTTINGEKEDDNEDGITIDTDTQELIDMDAKQQLEREQELELESRYLSTSDVELNPLKKRLSPTNQGDTAAASSVYFQDTVTTTKRVKRAHQDSSLSPTSTTSSTKDFYGLNGKRLMGIAASQDEGVELKFDSSSLAGASSMVPSVRENDDEDGDNEEGVEGLDDGVEALWKSGSSMKTTTKVVEQELSLQGVENEEQQEPNLDLLKHESSISSEPGSIDTTENPKDKKTGAKKTDAPSSQVETVEEEEEQDGNDDAAQHRRNGSEYDSSEDNMMIVCDSIHYIKNEPDYKEVEDDVGLNKSGAAPSGEGQEIPLDYKGEEDNADEEKAGTQSDSSNYTPSDDMLESSLAWEKERHKLGIASTADTDDMGTKSSGSSKSKGKNTDVDDLLQQQIENEFLPSTDSKLSFQKTSYMEILDGMKSPSDGSAFDVDSTLDGVDEATDAILEQIKADESKDYSKSTAEGERTAEKKEAIAIAEEAISHAENTAKEPVSERLRKATLAICEEIKKSEDEFKSNKAERVDAAPLVTDSATSEEYDLETLASLAGYESLEKKEDTSKSSSTKTATTAASGSVAASKSSRNSAMDDAVMQEYTVRREIATKVLGSKMLQGYKLRETQCEQCGMPQMVFKSIVHCVVCPVLAKKAKKELKKMKKIKEQDNKNEDEEDYDQKSVEDAIIDEVLQKHEEESTARSAVEEFSHQKSIKSALKASSSSEKSSRGSTKSVQLKVSASGSNASKNTSATSRASSSASNKSPQSASKPPKPPLSPSFMKGSKSSTPSSSKKSATGTASRKGLLPPKATQKKNLKTADVVEALRQSTEKYEADTKKTGKSVQKSIETSTTTSDGWLYIASKSPPDIKTANTRRKLLDTNEEILLEEAKAAKEELKKLHKAEKTTKGDKRLAELKKRKAEATRAQEFCNDQLNLIVEIKRLETMERMRLANEIEFKSSQEKLLAVFALQEERKRLRKEAKRLKEIRSLEAARKQAEIEEARQKVKLEATRKKQLKHIAKERATNEAEIAALEQEADRKRQAKSGTPTAEAPMEDTDSGIDDDIADIIAQGDADTIAEVSAIVRAEAEDYHEDQIHRSESFLWNERWETLRLEGRSVMTRRLISGWTMLPQYCKGRECHSSPLLTRDQAIECVVCGGSGTGKDGAYDAPPQEAKKPSWQAYSLTEDESLSSDGRFDGPTSTVERTSTTLTNKAIPSDSSDVHPPSKARPSKPNLSLQSVQQIHDDFEEKRQTVSKEIGKRMLQGWTLLDMSCPNCVMPLLTDEGGDNQICVLCGVVGKLNKGADADPSEGTGGYRRELTRRGFADEQAHITECYDKAATCVSESRKGCKDAAPQFECVEENEHIAELSTMLSDTRKGMEKYANKKAQVLSKQTKAYMDDRRVEMEEQAQILSRQTKAYMDDRRAEMEEACDAGRMASMAYLEDQMEENCGPEHMARIRDMQAQYGETKDILHGMMKEGETAIGRQLMKTSAFVLQKPAVQGMVAIMSQNPCSPTSLNIEAPCMSPKSANNQNLKATIQYQNKQAGVQKKESFELGLEDIGDLGLTGSSFSVPNLGIPGKGQPSETSKDGRSFSSEAREMLYGVSSEDVAITPSPKQEKYAIRAGSFEDLANQLSQADKEHRLRQAKDGKEIPSDEDTLDTMDSMQPGCDKSIIEDSIPSPRKKVSDSIFEGSKQSSPKSKTVKKGAAATALELIRDRRGKKESEMVEKSEKDLRSFSFSANNRALKPLTIDTSPTKNAATPMSPRTPKTGTSARRASPKAESPRYTRSSPRSSPNLGGRRSPSPRPESPGGGFRDYNDRLQHLLTTSPRTSSAPTSPQKPSRSGQDYLINFIAGRKSPSQPHNHVDPPAMVSNHVISDSGRRVARDPEDRSVYVDDDNHSVASASSRASSRFSRRSPRSTRPFTGASPGGRRPESLFSFPDSPTKVIHRNSENDEAVTLVIPKDFDITNDAQLRNLIMAAKKGHGPSPSPSSYRLALEGRIKHMGEAEFIDVTDMELSDLDINVIDVSADDENVDSSNSPRRLKIRTNDAPSPDKADYSSALRQSPNNAGAKNIVISQMHPPSPGESPFNNNRPRRSPRPKITPESMQRMNRNKPTSQSKLRLSPVSSRPPSPREAPSNDSSGSGGSINFENALPDQFFSKSSSTSGKDRPGRVLANMSFSSIDGEGSRYNKYMGDSLISESMGSATAGLPPISPRKRATRRPSTGSFQEENKHQDPPVTSCVESVSSSTAAGDNSTTKVESGDENNSTNAYGGNSTVASGDTGFETGVTEGRSSCSSDQSYSSTKRRQAYSSSSDGEQDIMVLNSRTDLGDIEVATGLGARSPRTPRRSRRELIAAKSSARRTAARLGREAVKGTDAGGEVKRSTSTRNEIISVGDSASFDGIITRLDSFKTKLASNGGGDGDGAGKEVFDSNKMASFIGKLTEAAEDVSTNGETTDDENYSNMSSQRGYVMPTQYNTATTTQ